MDENEPDEPGWTKEILISGKVSLIVGFGLIPVSYKLGLGTSQGKNQGLGWFSRARHLLLGESYPGAAL